MDSLHVQAFMGQAFEGSPVAMAIIDARDGRYLRVNDAACGLLGRARCELLALGFRDVTHPEDLAGLDHGRWARAAAKLGQATVEKRYVRPDRETVWATVFVTPMREPGGRVCAFFAQIIDISAAKAREARVAREMDDLARLTELRAALYDDRLLLYGQPIVDLASGATVQQELLLRLRRATGEVLAPGDFLPAAERYGGMREVDRWVCRRALDLAARGRPVEVNLSAESIGDDELFELLHTRLCRDDIDPSNLVFEITETAMIDDLERGRAFAQALRGLGCSFALDDFGTGWGALTSVKHIPIDYLKIDREFVRDLLVSDADARVVKTIISLAREFGAQTVAEGVEDAATAARLRELGVDLAQGYHLGRPAPLACAGPAHGTLAA